MNLRILPYPIYLEVGTVIVNKVLVINNMIEPHSEYVKIGDTNTCYSQDLETLSIPYLVN